MTTTRAETTSPAEDAALSFIEQQDGRLDYLRFSRVVEVLGKRQMSARLRLVALDWGYRDGPAAVLRAFDAPARDLRVNDWHDLQAARLHALTQACARDMGDEPDIERQKALYAECTRVGRLSDYVLRVDW